MRATTQIVLLDGAVLRRGFWLYVWEVTTPDGAKLVYVGRTGDISSANAQSPFHRMGQNLGHAKTSSMLRNHLGKQGLDPEQCTFRMVAHGPILEEAEDMAEHKVRRDLVAAMERELAKELDAAGYLVMNEVRSRKLLDEDLYSEVRAAFSLEFDGLWSPAPSA